MADKDYYAILGIARDATEEDIRRAFRRAALDCHPDRNPDHDGAEFRRLAEAYAVLVDSARRAEYDRESRSVRVRVNYRPPKPEVVERDLYYRLTISPAEALFGGTMMLSIPRDVICEACGGSGLARPGPTEACGFCGGFGQLYYERGPWRLARICPVCGGSGADPNGYCLACHGQGRRRTLRGVRVEVPRGARDGDLVLLSGEGGADEFGRHGDLYVLLHVREPGAARHPAFDWIHVVRPDWFKR